MTVGRGGGLLAFIVKRLARRMGLSPGPTAATGSANTTLRLLRSSA